MPVAALKSRILRAADGLGLNRVARHLLRNRLLALCYHAVVPDGTPDDPRTTIAVTQSQFRSQLQELRRNWTPVTEQDILNACAHEGPALPPNPVLVTFDDGFRNNLEYAAPLLEEHDVPAIFFISTGLVGSQRMLWTQEVTERLLAWPEHVPFPEPGVEALSTLPGSRAGRFAAAREIVRRCKGLPDTARRDYLARIRANEMNTREPWQETLYQFMSREEVRTLHERGFAIGAHTVDHPILTSLSQEALRGQLAESKAEVEQITGAPCLSLAYPNGGEDDYSHEVIRMAKTLGFRLGFTLRGRRNPRTIAPMEIDRVCVTRDMSFEAFKACAAGWR